MFIFVCFILITTTIMWEDGSFSHFFKTEPDTGSSTGFPPECQGAVYVSSETCCL